MSFYILGDLYCIVWSYLLNSMKNQPYINIGINKQLMSLFENISIGEINAFVDY